MKTILVVLAIALVPSDAFAVDGVVLINQSTVMAAGGFPYIITQPGSYKLSGNLVVPNDVTTAIIIVSDHVTIDFNGFSITGPVDCSVFQCTPPLGGGSAAGVSTGGNHNNITLRNGTIQGMGYAGIFLHGDSILVEGMHVRSNGEWGIIISKVGPTPADQTADNVILRLNNAQNNGIVGLALFGSGLIAENVSTGNGLAGIRFDGPGIVSHNVASKNKMIGLVLSSNQISYTGNVMAGNGSDQPPSFGVNHGQNLCGTSSCPGATQ